MAKTREEVEALKENWKSDPIWDLYETEGFEEYEEELKAYQEECEAAWNEEREAEEEEIDEAAEKLGIKGLYRIVMRHRELLDKHSRAIEALADQKYQYAYKILKGWDD